MVRFSDHSGSVASCSGNLTWGGGDALLKTEHLCVKEVQDVGNKILCSAVIDSTLTEWSENDEGNRTSELG